MTNIRESLIQMERVLTRRAFFVNVIKGASAVAVYDRFGPKIFGDPVEDPLSRAYEIFGAFGRLVIPVDQDPGWATFEPEITEYGLGTYVRQVFTLGNDLAFGGLLQAINAFNEIPPQIDFGPKFLEMSLAARADYLTKVLAGAFEYDGVQDILSFGGVFMLLGVKQTFFLNFPHHLANPDAEFQDVLGNTPRTGWDIMRFKGPVGADEEERLRARNADSPELPGVDWGNPFI
ncbi:MAG: hypothetical protein P8020_12160 [Acidobacteriota bacterium]|jgi:hypothetical protein